MVQLPTSRERSSDKSRQPPGALAASAGRFAAQQAKVDRFRRWRGSRAGSVAQKSRRLVMSGVVSASNQPPAYQQRGNKIPQGKYGRPNRDPPAVGRVDGPGQGSPNENVPDNSWVVRSDTDGNFELNPATEILI